jgi:glycosyltransferase involved in cell wall biosynthesis
MAVGSAAPAVAAATDVLIVSLGSTAGLRAADMELAQSLHRAGVSATVARAAPPRAMRTLALTDLGWSLAARRAAREELDCRCPRAVIYSSTTAALLWPRPGAIRFDAPSAGNRPGRHGLWQRPLERRRLRQASLLLPWSESGLIEAPAAAQSGDRALVLPVPVEPSGSSESVRDIAAITYAANPRKKGLDRVLEAWRALRRAGAPERGELLVAGASAQELSAAGVAIEAEPGVRSVGPLDAPAYRALLRRSKVFVCAPRREDYGAAQLEALADGCMLVSTPAPGPYVALEIARRLDGRLIEENLARALASALDEPRADYAARARAELEPFSAAAIDERVARELLPRLLS